MSSSFYLPVPEEGVDYYTETLNEYTVSIEVRTTGLAETTSEAAACADAVDRFRAGTLDGDSMVMNTTNLKDVKLCWDTDLKFDEVAWLKTKLLEMGVHADGTSLRPWERIRPVSETKLSDFGRCPWYCRLVTWITRLLPDDRRVMQ